MITSTHHKDHASLHAELTTARKKVKVGGIYAHYKYPENTYKVLHLGFREATDILCVIYQATYDEQLIFVREIDSWLETPEMNGHKTARFKLIS